MSLSVKASFHLNNKEAHYSTVRHLPAQCAIILTKRKITLGHKLTVLAKNLLKDRIRSFGSPE